ncbi:hypothetical protein BT69DRAFT_1335016 [Atractiella rhizophila]|nr:hypothetical protein BT69DRAFT_1335016 [Atractiella rhizophila]
MSKDTLSQDKSSAEEQTKAPVKKRRSQSKGGEPTMSVCRANKRKCVRDDDPTGACQGCRKKGLICTFEPRKPRRKPSKRDELTLAGMGQMQLPFSKPYAAPVPGVDHQLIDHQIAGSLMRHLIEEHLKANPFNIVTDCVNGDLLDLFEKSGREGNKMWKFGEALLATVLASGAQYSCHAAILGIHLPHEPPLSGDLSMYSRSREPTILALTQRAMQLVEQTVAHVCYESVVVFMALVILLSTSLRQREAAAVFRRALEHYRLLMHTCKTQEDKQLFRDKLGAWIWMSDTGLARSLKSAPLMQDSDILDTVVRGQIPHELYLSVDEFLNQDPCGELPARAEILSIGGKAFNRLVAQIVWNAQRTIPTQALELYRILLTKIVARHSWLSRHHQHYLASVPHIGPVHAVDNSFWVVSDRLEYSFHLFAAMDRLEEYCSALPDPTEFQQLYQEYAELVEQEILRLASWSKKNVMEPPPLSSTSSAKQMYLIATIFQFLPGGFHYLPSYLHRQTTKAGLQEKIDSIGWILKALQVCSFFDTRPIEWAHQLQLAISPVLTQPSWDRAASFVSMDGGLPHHFSDSSSVTRATSSPESLSSQFEQFTNAFPQHESFDTATFPMIPPTLPGGGDAFDQLLKDIVH